MAEIFVLKLVQPDLPFRIINISGNTTVGLMYPCIFCTEQTSRENNFLHYSNAETLCGLLNLKREFANEFVRSPICSKCSEITNSVIQVFQSIKLLETQLNSQKETLLSFLKSDKAIYTAQNDHNYYKGSGTIGKASDLASVSKFRKSIQEELGFSSTLQNHQTTSVETEVDLDSSVDDGLQPPSLNENNENGEFREESIQISQEIGNVECRSGAEEILIENCGVEMLYVQDLDDAFNTNDLCIAPTDQATVPVSEINQQPTKSRKRGQKSIGTPSAIKKRKTNNMTLATSNSSKKKSKSIEGSNDTNNANENANNSTPATHQPTETDTAVTKQPPKRANKKSRKTLNSASDSDKREPKRKSPKVPTEKPKRKSPKVPKPKKSTKVPAEKPERPESYLCDDCGQDFKIKYYFLNHKHRAHGMPLMARCTRRGCSKEFLTKAELKEHQEENHPLASFQCDTCGKILRSNRALTHHLTLSHAQNIEHFQSSEEQQPVFKFSCEVCHYHTNSNAGILRHNDSNSHKAKFLPPDCPPEAKLPSKRTPFRCPEPDCEVSLPRYHLLDRHLEMVHSRKLEIENLHFPSKAEFDEWKASLQGTENIRYSYVYSGIRPDIKKYICSRGGRSRSLPDDVRIKKGKSLGSIKTGKACPSRLLMEILPDGGVAVKYYKTHIGHDLDPRRFGLTMDKKLELVKLLAQGMSRMDVIRQIKSSCTDSNQRISYLSRNDMRQISKRFFPKKSKAQPTRESLPAEDVNNLNSSHNS